VITLVLAELSLGASTSFHAIRNEGRKHAAAMTLHTTETKPTSPIRSIAGIARIARTTTKTTAKG
jgi:hypothetical protein